MVKDALGEPIRLETVSEASDGSDIQLTLDPAIETKTEQVLNEVGETYAPKGATAIVVDPRSSKSWRWPTGRRSTPPTSRTPATKTC